MWLNVSISRIYALCADQDATELESAQMMGDPLNCTTRLDIKDIIYINCLSNSAFSSFRMAMNILGKIMLICKIAFR